jgi:hypothetical protein
LSAHGSPEPEPVIPSLSEEEATASAAPTETAAPETSIPVAAAAPTGSPLPSPLRHLTAEGIPSARGRDRATPLSRFTAGFSDEVLEETAKKVTAWGSDVNTTTSKQ